MNWIEHRNAAMVQRREEHGDVIGADNDIAKVDQLTDEERDWLAGLLVSRQAPETVMSFETLDGFMTALVIGPAMVPPSEYLPEVWGTDNGSGPAWDSKEQAQYGLGLLMKHWNAIAARRMADALHRPQIEFFGTAFAGEEWASGFLDGVEMRPDEWGQIFRDRKTARLLAPMTLLSDGQDHTGETLSKIHRERLIAGLPETVRRIAAYWRDPPGAFSREIPVRSTKVGRNEACPCGSGKKFKRCCGSDSGSSVH